MNGEVSNSWTVIWCEYRYINFALSLIIHSMFPTLQQGLYRKKGSDIKHLINIQICTIYWILFCIEVYIVSTYQILNNQLSSQGSGTDSINVQCAGSPAWSLDNGFYCPLCLFYGFLSSRLLTAKNHFPLQDAKLKPFHIIQSCSQLQLVATGGPWLNQPLARCISLVNFIAFL